MKKILLVAMMFLLFAGVVSASSLNGDYNGNPIIIVKSNGKQLQSDEVPAMIIDGHTMVPISLLRQIGVEVNWNADTYTVDVKLPQTQPQNSAAPNSRNGNNSTIQTGDNKSFQFVGMNDYYDKFDHLHIAGQVKNVSGKTTSMFINITATLFDKDGGVVGTQDAPAHFGSLQDGESYSFDIIFYNTPKNSVRYEIHVKG